jgi:AraC family transcriptional regulator
MSIQSAVIYRNAEAVKASSVPMLTTGRLYGSAITITEFKCDEEDIERNVSITRNDGYLILFMARDCRHIDVYCDDKNMRPINFLSGHTAIYDLRENLSVDMTGPYHCLHFYLPYRILEGIAVELGSPRISKLMCLPGMGMEDPVVRQLLTSLLPCMRAPDRSNMHFVDHVALAVSSHVAQAYGGMSLLCRAPRGGLAPWQERRAKELLSASVDKEVSLSQLAEACGLSVRHFGRAFRQSTGIPPHRWLLKQRVDQAKTLLVNPALSLAEIALSCGFSDQSHFTRVYSALVGMSPGVWRRARIQSR